MPKTGKNSKGNIFKKKASTGSADFKRKTAKVGKKVERATVTKISVESRQINVPLQSKISLGNPKDENDIFNRTIKQLRHYSHSNRTQALVDLQNFLLTCQDPESYSSLVMPEAMELLFDDDADAREALLRLMFTITTNVDAQTIEPVMPVLVTYICSGLTSLNKGVRKDSLLLLGQISMTGVARLLPPFTNKILQNILGLLDRASLIFHSGAGMKGGHAGGSSVKTGATWDTSSSQGTMRGGAKGPRPGELVAAKGASETAPESHLLVLLLRVVRGLLSNSNSDKESAEEVRRMTGSGRGASGVGAVRTVVPFVAMKIEPVFFSSLASLDNATAATLGSERISLTHEKQLCEQLNIVWGRLTTEGSHVKASTVRTLHEAVGSMISLGSRPLISSSCDAFLPLIVRAFNHFPYVSYESGVSSVSPTNVEECLQMTKSLNVALCEAALLACKWAPRSERASNEGKNDASCRSSLSHLLSMSLSYLLQCLDDLDRAMQMKARVPEQAGEAVQAEGADTSLGGQSGDHGELDVDMDGANSDMDSEAVEGSKKAKEVPSSSTVEQPSASPSRRFEKKGEALSLATLLAYRRQDDEQTKCLFRCLKMIVLDCNVCAWCTDTPEEKGQEGAVTRILRGLAGLTGSIASFTVEGGSKRQHGQKDIRNIISACLECLASMCIDDQPRLDLATHGRDEDDQSVLLKDILNILRPLLCAPSLLCLKGWPSELRDKVTDMFIEALLSVVRRLPSCSIRSEGNRGAVLFVDERTGESLMKIGGTRHDGEEVDLHPLIRCLQDDLYVSNTDSGCDGRAFYSTCNEGQRQNLLHLFAVAPFSDFSKVVQALALVISRADPTHLPEQKSFLDAVVRRKRDINPGVLTTVLLRVLEQNNDYTRKGCRDSHDVLYEALRVSRDKAWLGTAVAQALMDISTPSKPVNIVKFLQRNIKDMLQAGLKPVDSSKGPSQRQWLARVYHGNAAVAIVSTLFRPCLAFIGGQDDDNTVVGSQVATAREVFVPILDSLSELVVYRASCELEEVFAAETMGAFCDEAQHNEGLYIPSSGLNALFLSPLIRLLVIKAPRSVIATIGIASFERNSALADSLPTSHMQQYPFLCAYLRYLRDEWSTWRTSVDQEGLHKCLRGQLALVQSLERVLRHDACQPTAFQSRPFLRALVAELQTGLVGIITGEQEAESKLRFHIKSILRDLEEDMK